MKCKALHCGRNSMSNPTLKFFRFPKDKTIRLAWIRFCVKNEDDVEFFEVKGSSRVCSVSWNIDYKILNVHVMIFQVHFPTGKKNVDGSTAVPTLREPNENVDCDYEMEYSEKPNCTYQMNESEKHLGVG